MTLDEAQKQIQSCAKQMDDRYGRVVFDEWAVVSLIHQQARILAYIGPRNDAFLKNFADDLGTLRAELLKPKYSVGDFEFARHGTGTGFEAFMVLGKGIYLIKIKEKKPAAVPPLAQIRNQVSQSAAVDKARDLAKKKADEALAQLAKGGAALKLQETGSFGYVATGVVPRIGTSTELMEAAFALTAANQTAKTSFKIGDRWYAVKLKQRTEANSADFPKSKEQLKQALLPKKQQEALLDKLYSQIGQQKVEIDWLKKKLL